MKDILFKGVATALYTPIDKNNKIDYDELKNEIIRQLKANINAIILLGTTGEPSTIEDNERIEIIKCAIKTINDKIPLIVGCSSNNTKKVINDGIIAKNLGASGILCVTPYYNKCSNSGLVKHFEEISSCVNLPIIVYNVPNRTSLDIDNKTLIKLANIKNVIGIKQAVSDELKLKNCIELLYDKIAVYIGNDNQLIYGLSNNATGIISVVSNIIPQKICDIFNDFEKNYKINAMQKFEEIKNFISSLSIEVNPIPLKYVLKLLGKNGYNLRLPLTQIDSNKRLIIKNALNEIIKN